MRSLGIICNIFDRLLERVAGLSQLPPGKLPGSDPCLDSDLDSLGLGPSPHLGKTVAADK